MGVHQDLPSGIAAIEMNRQAWIRSMVSSFAPLRRERRELKGPTGLLCENLAAGREVARSRRLASSLRCRLQAGRSDGGAAGALRVGRA